MSYSIFMLFMVGLMIVVVLSDNLALKLYFYLSSITFSFIDNNVINNFFNMLIEFVIQLFNQYKMFLSNLIYDQHTVNMIIFGTFIVAMQPIIIGGFFLFKKDKY